MQLAMNSKNVFLNLNVLLTCSAAAPVGGYCVRPYECICRSGYSGALCQVGKQHFPHTTMYEYEEQQAQAT